MPYLLFVSLLWAFSPGLIKQFLGDLPSPAVATVRLGLTLLVFAPFLRASLNGRVIARLAGIGAVQFGLMYLLYLQAFQYLRGHEVYLFTIFTPLYIVLLEATLARRLVARHAFAALLSVIGAAIILQRQIGTSGLFLGFLLVQGSNLCFAAGQVAYKRIRPQLAGTRDAPLFAWLALGGFAATLLVAAPATEWNQFSPTGSQWLVLAFLGLVASGAGFFLWNLGVTRVNAGTLAVFNNLKIPLGVAVSLIFFREAADLPRLLLSGALMFAAVVVAEGWLTRAKSG